MWIQVVPLQTTVARSFCAMLTTVAGVSSLTVSASAASAALVIVKPLAHLLYAEIGTIAEQTYYPRFPKIESGAYLNVLRSQVGATPNARVFTGLITTIRS